MKTGTKRFLAALFAAILAALGAFSGALAEGSARTLTIGFGHALENYAPTTAYETKSTMANLAYETIVQYENGEIVPCLAESWAWNGDGTVLTLNVRKGVKFHDGEPLDAEAMAKNLRWANANPLYGFFKGISLIERVDVIDAYTLTVTYPSLYYAALQDLCSPVQMGIVSPAMLDMEKLDSMNGTAGTGPYAYDHYDTEKDAAIFRKNAEYWGGDAKYDEVIVRNIPDAAARLMALEAGEIDMIFGSDWISYDDYERAVAMENIAGKTSESDVRTRVIVLNAANEALGDAKVRKAIACAVDKQGIVEGFMHGYEAVADQPLSASLPYCDVQIRTVQAYDMEQAAALLKEAGWSDTDGDGILDQDGAALSLTFKYPQERALNAEMAEVVKASLGELGIQVETIPMEYMLWAQATISGDFDISINTTNGHPYDPQNVVNAILSGMDGAYPSILALPDGQAMIDKGLKTLGTSDEAVVNEIYSELINYLLENTVNIPVSTQKEVVLYRGDRISDVAFGGATNLFDVFGVAWAQ